MKRSLIGTPMRIGVAELEGKRVSMIGFGPKARARRVGSSIPWYFCSNSDIWESIADRAWQLDGPYAALLPFGDSQCLDEVHLHGPDGLELVGILCCVWMKTAPDSLVRVTVRAVSPWRVDRQVRRSGGLGVLWGRRIWRRWRGRRQACDPRTWEQVPFGSRIVEERIMRREGGGDLVCFEGVGELGCL